MEREGKERKREERKSIYIYTDVFPSGRLFRAKGTGGAIFERKATNDGPTSAVTTLPPCEWPVLHVVRDTRVRVYAQPTISLFLSALSSPATSRRHCETTERNKINGYRFTMAVINELS